MKPQYATTAGPDWPTNRESIPESTAMFGTWTTEPLNTVRLIRAGAPIDTTLEVRVGDFVYDRVNSGEWRYVRFVYSPIHIEIDRPFTTPLAGAVLDHNRARYSYVKITHISGAAVEINGEAGALPVGGFIEFPTGSNHSGFTATVPPLTYDTDGGAVIGITVLGGSTRLA